MKHLLILGASSGMARAIAARFAQDGWTLMLAGRNLEELHKDAEDLRIRYQAQATTHRLDALDIDSHGAFFNDLPAQPMGVVCAIGILGDQDQAQQDEAHAQKILATNFSGCVSLLGEAARRLEAQGSGFIVGIGSVAGDRGRQSNYYYGSAKAGFAAWLSGLRNRLSKKGVHVVTVKPGFVATKMTEHLDLPPLLTGQPQQVAEDVYKAVKKGRDVIYTRWFWRYIMLIIRTIPERIFKGLSL